MIFEVLDVGGGEVERAGGGEDCVTELGTK